MMEIRMYKGCPVIFRRVNGSKEASISMLARHAQDLIRGKKVELDTLASDSIGRTLEDIKNNRPYSGTYVDIAVPLDEVTAFTTFSSRINSLFYSNDGVLFRVSPAKNGEISIITVATMTKDIEVFMEATGVSYGAVKNFVCESGDYCGQNVYYTMTENPPKAVTKIGCSFREYLYKPQ